MFSSAIGTLKPQPSGFKAFIPHPFPPKNGFHFDAKLLKKDNEATRLLGKLDGITKLLPDADFFLLMYLRKDAASSSQIEGTMATMVDAIEAEVKLSDNIPKDVDDILHYIKALNYGIKRVTKDNFPITLRFIRELHKELMHDARTTHFSDPGEFRKSQNWIGGTRPDNARFVPPPVSDMNKSLGELELFMHADDATPILIKAGLIHAQFETIHPFLDGNGRTGRMLITFYLWKEGFLEKPVLFLSSYFKKHQQIYYDKLTNYHNGKVHEWIDFFLDGVIEIAKEAIAIVDKITALRDKDLEKIQTFGKRASESAIMVLPKLYAQPIVNTATIQKWTSFTRAGAQTIIDRFINVGILTPRNKDKKYGQSYEYKKYLSIFAEKSAIEIIEESIEPMLKQSGWGIIKGSKILREYIISPGQLQPNGQYSNKLIIDYILVYQGRKIALIEVKNDEAEIRTGILQAKNYAEKLDIATTFVCNSKIIYQICRKTSKEGLISNFPTPSQLWNKTFPKLNEWQIKFNQVPFEEIENFKTVRFFQEIAINNTLDAIAQKKHRILLTLATGTGKTFIAFQITWKLFQTYWNLNYDGSRRPRILFLTASAVIAEQTFNSFSAFPKKALIQINAKEIRKKDQQPINGNIFFTTYSTLMSTKDNLPYFKEYPADYFDLIIADDIYYANKDTTNAWHSILEYFSPAIQLGLTIPLKRKSNINNYHYFGEPVYSYHYPQK